MPAYNFKAQFAQLVADGAEAFFGFFRTTYGEVFNGELIAWQPNKELRNGDGGAATKPDNVSKL